MMLTLYGLPLNFHYKDVKALIRTQCEIVDFILDNLTTEGGFKKIRVGLATDTEGNHLLKCLDGFQIQGCMLKVMPIVKTQNTTEPPPVDNYNRDMMQPSYDATVQPSPWMSQEPHWQGNQAEAHSTYQHFPQNQPYVQSQQHQSIPIVNRQPANRFQTQQNYEKPITIMKDNFQGPQYVQQNQPAQYEAPQQSWSQPHMQQGQQFNQVPNTGQVSTRHGNRQLRECEVRAPINEPEYNEVSATSTHSHSQFGPPLNRQVPQQMSGRRISPGRDMTTVGGEHRRLSPRRNVPERRISPSRAMDHPRNRSPADRRRELGHIRRVSPTEHHLPSGRPVLLSGRYDAPSGQAPSMGHVSTAGRHMPQGGRHISPPGRRMPQGSRHISPPGRQMPHGNRHGSPPGRQMPPGDRYASPPRRQMPQSGRHISPPGRQVPQGGRHISPPGRQMPQSGQHIPPMGRQVQPGIRQISPPGLHKMPQGGPHISPSARNNMLQSGRHISPPGRQLPQGGRRISPPGRQVPQVARHLSPPGRPALLAAPPGRQVLQGRLGSPPGRMQMGRQDSPPNRHVPPIERQKSPSRLGGRQLSPSGRRISPTWRRISPSGRQVLIRGRNVSPSGRFSPPGRTVLVVQSERTIGRHTSPNRPSMDRRNSPIRAMPSGRIVSPGRRISPSGRPLRQHSPNIRRASPMRPHLRYSSPQHKGPMGKYDQEDTRSGFKQAIQLYDKASDQNIFTSGFRPNEREDKPYPRKSPRESRWQEREQFPTRNADRSLMPHKNELNRFSEQQRAVEQRKKSRSLTRESLRDRSPIRAPKRHSPSPRSPRRSWALEKRNSPDIKEAPPPPSWPGQKPHFQIPDRPHYTGRNPKEEQWQHKMDDCHRAHPNFDEKDCISNWKPTDRSPRRFAEVHRNKESKHFDKEAAYYREREKSRGIPHRADGRQNYEVRHHPYRNEETPHYPDHPNKASVQKQDYKEKETKQDSYIDDSNRSAAHQTNSKHKITPQDKNPKEFIDAKPINKLNDSNKEKMSASTKEKRKKVAAEIAANVLEKFRCHLSGKNKQQRAQLILEEAKAEIERTMYKMYGNKDVPEKLIHSHLNAAKYSLIFSRSVTTVMHELKKKRMQNAGNSNQRLKAGEPQKRPPAAPKRPPAKVAKLDETHTQINKDPTKSSQAAAKQPEDKVAPAKQPGREQAVKPTPKLAQVDAATVPTAAEDAPKTDAKRQSGELKVLTVAQINEQTHHGPDKQDGKAEDKCEEKTTNSEDTGGGNYFELNELMSNVLKQELRGIMDKVWSCLLVQPDSPAEVMAVDLIRHEGVDRIREAIGLNVAKRLLNVFNPLLVKIQFSCRPENGCLTQFLKQHNIKSFKRIPNAEDTFAAQLHDVGDFDVLCHTKDVKCGSADLKITPFYKFTQCPPNLKLNLDDDDYYVYPSDDECDDEDNDIDTQMFDEFVKDVPVESMKVKPDDQPKPESQNDIKANKSELSKSDIKNEEISKTTPNKEGTKSLLEKPSNAKPPDAKTKDIPSKNVSNEKSQSVEKKQKNMGESKVAETPKVSAKNKVANEKSNKAVINEKNTAQLKDNSNKDKTVERKAEAISEQNKNSASKAQKRKKSGWNNDVRNKIVKSKPKRNTYEVVDEAYDDDDDEELNDEDILALLAGGGVVLDECGSDD